MSALIVTGLICGLIFLTALKRPQWGVLAIAALVPFHGLLIIAPVALSLWKEAAVLAVAVAALLASRARDRATVAPWLAPAAVLVLFGVISAVWVLRTNAGFPIKIAFFYLLVAVIVYYHPFTRRDKDHLVTILLTTGTLSALFGLAQQVLGGERLVEMGYDWNESLRTTGPLLRSFGTFNQPFPFGLYLMLVLVVVGTVALSQPGRLRSRIFWLLSPVLVAAMLSSVVRAAFVGLIVAVFVVGVIIHRRLLIYAGILLAAVLVAIPFAVAVDQRGVLAALFSSSSLEDRGGHWAATLPRMLVRPLGDGLGTTGSAAEKVLEAFYPRTGLYQPDNQYLKVGLELGVLGLALYAVTIGMAIVVLRRVIRVVRDPLEQGVAAGVLAATAAACVAAAFSTYLEIFPMDFFFWFLLAVAASLPREEARAVGGWRRERNPERRARQERREALGEVRRGRTYVPMIRP